MLKCLTSLIHMYTTNLFYRISYFHFQFKDILAKHIYPIYNISIKHIAEFFQTLNNMLKGNIAL